MSYYETRRHIGQDGKATADVIPESTGEVDRTRSHGARSRQEWLEAIHRAAGSIDDPTFEIPPRVPFDLPEPLD